MIVTLSHAGPYNDYDVVKSVLSGLSRDEVVSLGKTLGLGEETLKAMTDIPGTIVILPFPASCVESHWHVCNTCTCTCTWNVNLYMNMNENKS